jgi:hypothetical protein
MYGRIYALAPFHPSSCSSITWQSDAECSASAGSWFLGIVAGGRFTGKVCGCMYVYASRSSVQPRFDGKDKSSVLTGDWDVDVQNVSLMREDCGGL